ncbi:hypothetical protein CVT25_002657 [Psilocybe cyanescens]|uniref:Uncharacterized protein n=1 Tax=Psilocybe cyanescens TaxID=93625 RepID=A0A409WLL1_PSICY|nr:hypothetical protein CVT25_002657 [Psilocybe cyanescens]
MSFKYRGVPFYDPKGTLTSERINYVLSEFNKVEGRLQAISIILRSEKRGVKRDWLRLEQAPVSVWLNAHPGRRVQYTTNQKAIFVMHIYESVEHSQCTLPNQLSEAMLDIMGDIMDTVVPNATASDTSDSD